MEDNKNMNNGTVNETQGEKEQQGTNNQASDNNEEIKKDGIFKKFGNGFKKHGKKVLVPVGIAAVFAAGIAADKFGLSAFKKTDAEQTEDQQ